MLLHASCVAFTDKAVLITGEAGAGKSDLALRLMYCGGLLVADDQTELNVQNSKLIASAPQSIMGLIEVRHVGLLRVPHVSAVPVALHVELAPLDAKLERLPEAGASVTHLGIPIRKVTLPGFAPSTPVKIRAALIYESAISY